MLRKKVSGKHDLFGWRKYDQISAGVRRRPVPATVIGRADRYSDVRLLNSKLSVCPVLSMGIADLRRAALLLC